MVDAQDAKKCETCDGKGTIPTTIKGQTCPRTCPACKGSGKSGLIRK